MKRQNLKNMNKYSTFITIYNGEYSTPILLHERRKAFITQTLSPTQSEQEILVERGKKQTFYSNIFNKI